MALPEGDKEPTTLIVLDDLRRLFDHISANYANLKNRALGLLAGEVAITSFIFSGDKFNLKYFTSAEKILFLAGIILLAVAFGFLLWIVATAGWQIPLGLNESKKLYKRFHSKLEYLEDIKEDYEECIGYCLSKMESRSKAFNRTLYVLASAIIIMLVIKFTR
jgi:hypothetical protein